MKKAFCVYYWYDGGGRLLYIGCTKILHERTGWHRLYAPWFSDAKYLRRRWFDARDEALKFERCAIDRRRPAYNKDCRWREHRKPISYCPMAELYRQVPALKYLNRKAGGKANGG